MLIEARATKYQTFYSQLKGVGVYKPSLAFYCEVNEGGNYRGIVALLNTQLIRESNGISKQFAGDVYTKLESANTIKYTVNGDFYENGSVSISKGVSIKVGEFITYNYTITESKNFYGYMYDEGKFSLYPE